MLNNQLSELLQPYNEVIFDLDNTLFSQQSFDSGAFTDIEHYLRSYCQVPLEGFAQFLQQHKVKMGSNYGFLFNDALAHFQLPQTHLKSMLKHYYQHDGGNIDIKKSLLPALSQIFADKLTFIVTNGPTQVQQTKVSKLQLTNKVTDIIICDPKKPEHLKPSSYAFEQLTKKHLMINPVMVGDSLETDALFAKNINIPFIHFIYSSQNNEH